MKQKETVRIEDRAELVGFLRTLGTECRFITVETETVVENMPKRGNPYVGTVKIARRNGIVNMSFVKGAEKRYAEQHGLKPSQVTYTPGETWYRHVMTADKKPLCLCEHSENPTKKYMQFFPLRDLGETVYVHPTLGRLTAEQVTDMEGRFYGKNSPSWKPTVITLAIDSIRSVTFRKIRLENNTVSRLVGRLNRFKGLRVSTKAKREVMPEEQRRDEKHGLYPQHEDPAN